MPASSDTPDNANVLAPAPVFYLMAFLLGFILDHFYPLPILTTGYTTVPGIILIIASIPIALSAVLELRKAGTAFDARQTSTALVTAGSFRFSRNPTYLSLTMLFTGAALVLNTLFILIGVLLASIVTHVGVILREEKYMSAKFGTAYADYKDKVRRWI